MQDRGGHGPRGAIRDEHRLVCKNGIVKWVSLKAQMFMEDGEQYFMAFLWILPKKSRCRNGSGNFMKRNWPFCSGSLAKGSIQGRVNVTQNKVENYMAASDTAIAALGDSYEKNHKKSWQVPLLIPVMVSISVPSFAESRR